MKYIVLGWNSRFCEPAFKNEHDSLEAAIRDASTQLTANHDQVTVEIFAAEQILIGSKLSWQNDGHLMTPARFEETRTERAAEAKAKKSPLKTDSQTFALAANFCAIRFPLPRMHFLTLR